MTQAFCQLPNLVGPFYINALYQIAAGDMANAVNQTVHRRDKRKFDAEPDRNNRRQHGNQHARQYPHRLAVRAVVIFNRNVIQTVILLHVIDILLLKTILIALRRLIKECVDLPFTQQLDQLRQRTMIDVIGAVDLLESGFTLTRVTRERFINRPVFFRQFQRRARYLHQFSNGRTAADIVLIHHVANTRPVKGVSRLQQFNPGGIQRRLLLANGLQNGKVLFVILQ